MARVSLDRTDMVRGMSRAVAPHLLPRNKWYDSYGMRHANGVCEQIARKYPWLQLGSSHVDYVTNLVAIPYGNRGRCFLLAADHLGWYRIRCAVGAPSFFELASSGGEPISLAPSHPGDRWATVLFNNRVFFSNQHNKIRWTEGEWVEEFGEDVPSALYLEIFYDHLVAANVMYKGVYAPNQLRWSDLRNTGIWRPSRQNEADYYNCLEKASSNEGFNGISGVKKLGNLLFTYTPTYIYASRYVGLPQVMITEPFIADVGCDFAYGLVSNQHAHFWPSYRHRNFFMFDGERVSSIGDDISAYFFETISPLHEVRQMAWGYLDRTNNEVAWVFPPVDKATLCESVIYNYREKHWYRAPVENISSFLEAFGGYIGADVGMFATTTNDQLGTVNNEDLLSANDYFIPRLWGSKLGQILRDCVDSDFTYPASGYVKNLPTPYLETWDEVYGSPHKTKDVESIVIHSKVGDDGLEVQVASRENLSDDPSFSTLPQIWKPTLPEKRLSLPRMSGRVLRYRFRPKADVEPSEPAPPETSWEDQQLVTLQYKVGVLSSEAGEPVEEPVYQNWSAPYDGKYRLSLIGQGGGGGARALIEKQPNTFASGGLPSGWSWRFPGAASWAFSPSILESYGGTVQDLMLSAYAGDAYGGPLNVGDFTIVDDYLTYLSWNPTIIDWSWNKVPVEDQPDLSTPDPYVYNPASDFVFMGLRSMAWVMEAYARKWCEDNGKIFEGMLFYGTKFMAGWLVKWGFPTNPGWTVFDGFCRHWVWDSKPTVDLGPPAGHVEGTCPPTQIIEPYGRDVLGCKFSYLEPSDVELWHAGGGSGGILQGDITLAKDDAIVVSQVGLDTIPGSTSVNGNFNGAAGLLTVVEKVGGTLKLTAGGGGGASGETNPPTPGVAGAAGVEVTDTGGIFETIFSQAGEPGTIDDPMPNPTDMAKGGRNWGSDVQWSFTKQSSAIPVMQGAPWGGGGSGGFPGGDLYQSSGGPGNVFVNYFLINDPDNPGSKIAKTDYRRTSTIVSDGSMLGNVHRTSVTPVPTINMRVRGVVELRTYPDSGWSRLRVNDYCLRFIDPAIPVLTRATCLVSYTGPYLDAPHVYVYCLNWLESPPVGYPVDPDYCQALDYTVEDLPFYPGDTEVLLSFSIGVDGGSPVIITPVDSNGSYLVAFDEVLGVRPQWIQIDFTAVYPVAPPPPPVYDVKRVHDWKFSGFGEDVVGVYPQQPTGIER